MNKLKYLILILVFISSIQVSLDLDLGWHLRYGGYFFQTGYVLKDNILSYFWTNYHWVQASWGYDLIVYQLFTNFSFSGLSILAALLSLIAFWILIYPIKKLSFFQLLFLAAIFISQSLSSFATGLRAQTFSPVFLALILVLISKAQTKPKLFYLFPVIFLVWANLHGGFVIGIFILFIYWLCSITINSNKNIIPFTTSLVLSFLTPLVNPWGINIYRESLVHVSNSNLSYITEWVPLINFPIDAIITASISLLVFYLIYIRRKLEDVPFLISFLVVTYLSFSSIRFLMYFAVLAVYYLAQNLKDFKIKPLAKQILKLSLVMLVLFDIVFTNRYFHYPLPQYLFNQSWANYCYLLGTCSEKITQIMISNPPTGNGFHPYEYGGYLSWRVPQIKTFIDGRMSAWQQNGQFPPIKEVMQENIAKNPISFKKLDDKYHFSWAIIPANNALENYLSSTGVWQLKYQDREFSYYIKKS